MLPAEIPERQTADEEIHEGRLYPGAQVRHTVGRVACRAQLETR